MSAIESEIRERQNYVPNVKTLYFGGGTPSVCTVEQIGSIIGLTQELWSARNFAEITLEANPEDLTPEYLAGLRNVGVDRLSIGIQSFFDEHLAKMNRRHTGTRAVRAVRDAQAAGFDNITVDLIYGLPWLSEQQWHSNIEQVLTLEVQHISAYHLTIEPKTILGKQHLQPVPDEVSERHFEILHNRLCQAGYEHYEVSNFALPDRRAIHNSGYWHGEPYLGVGPSAHSYDGSLHRHWNVSSNKLYLEGDRGESETLSTADRHNEYLMTRLRTADGFIISEYEEQFDTKITEVQGLIIHNGTARIAPSDFLISDSIISSLFV